MSVEQSAGRHPVLREIAIAALCGIIATVVGVLALHISPSDLAQRWTTGSDDQILHYMVTTSATRGPLYLTNPQLGFPTGQNLFFAPIFDPASAAELGLLSLVIHDGIVLLNVFYVLAFFFIGAMGYFAFRIFRVRRATSAIFAIVFALAPYHFQRIAMGHGFVANYWAIPLIAVALALVCDLDTPLRDWARLGKRPRVRRALVVVAVALPISLTLNYYFVFAILILGGVLIFRLVAGLLQRVPLRQFVWPALTVAGLTFFAGLQLLVLSLNFGDRYSRYFSARGVAESELYGGKITSLVLPWVGSRIPLLGSLSRRYHDESGLLPTSEPPGTPLLATIGMVLIIAFLLCQALRPAVTRLPRILDERVSVVAGAFLWTLLFFLSGGLGAIFAATVTGDIRAWSRLSIILVMLALLMVAITLDSLLRRLRWRVLSAVLIISIVVVDQLWGVAAALPILPSRDTALRQFVASVEKDSADGCGIVELPLKSFPESGKINKLSDYDLALPYLYSDGSVDWSYGSVRGTRAGNFWVDDKTVSEFAEDVRSSKACGIVVDTYGYQGQGWRRWVSSVTDLVPEAVSTDQDHRYRFYLVG